MSNIYCLDIAKYAKSVYWGSITQIKYPSGAFGTSEKIASNGQAGVKIYITFWDRDSIKSLHGAINVRPFDNTVHLHNFQILNAIPAELYVPDQQQWLKLKAGSKLMMSLPFCCR